MSKHSLSVIIPAYNEEQYVKDSVCINLNVLKASGIDYEIVIVDDGSTDTTSEIVSIHFSTIPTIKILKKDENEGFGSAIRYGIENISKDYILIVPVDCPLTNEIFNQFMNNLNKGDVLASYRIGRKGYSTRMKLNSRIYHLLVTLMFDINLKDYNWIHLYPSRLFKKDKVKISSNGFFMLAEVLIKAKKLGYRIYEFPVDHEMRMTGVANSSIFKVGLITLKDLFKYRFFGRA